MKKHFNVDDYVYTNGMSLQDCLMGPILDHLIPFTIHVYDMKTNESIVDRSKIKWDSKYLSRRVFAFSYAEVEGKRIITFDLEKARPLTDRRLFRVKHYDHVPVGYQITYRGSVVGAADSLSKADIFITSFIQGVRHTLNGQIIDKYFKR